MIEREIHQDTLQRAARLKHQALYDEKSGLYVSPFIGDEVAQYEEWYADEEVRRYLHPNSPFTTDPNVRVSAKEWITYLMRNPLIAAHRVTHPLHGLIGHMCLSTNAEENSLSHGGMIGTKYLWSKGHATSVLEIFMARAIELGYRKISSNCFVGNIASAVHLKKFYGPGKEVNGMLYFEKEL